MMQPTNLLDLSQLVLNDIQCIEYYLYASGCIYRPKYSPLLKNTVYLGEKRSSFVLVQCDAHRKLDFPALFGLSSSGTSSSEIHNGTHCSFTRILRGSNQDFPFIFELVEPPSFEPFPLPIDAVMGSQYRWAVYVKLSATICPAHGIKDLQHPQPINLALDLQILNGHIPSSWLTSVSTLNSSVLQKAEETICLCILTTMDLLSEVLLNSSLTMQLHLNVTYGAMYYNFALESPCNINFPTLMTQLTKSHRPNNKIRPVVLCSPWFHRFRRTWQVSTVATDATRDRSPTAMWRMISILFESKLGLLDMGTISESDSGWSWITIGPLAGIAVRFQSIGSDYNTITLEALSSRNAQLDLLERAIIECAPHIRLDRAPTMASIVPDIHSKPSYVYQVINCFLAELGCLTDLISNLIERTMRDRVPPIEEFLSTTGGHLDLANRASDWHVKASMAPLEPVGLTHASAEFELCLQATEDAISRICLATQEQS